MGLPFCLALIEALPAAVAASRVHGPSLRDGGHIRQVGTSIESESVYSQLFHGLAPCSLLRRLAVRFRRSRSNTSTEYSLPGATQLSPPSRYYKLKTRDGGE